MSDEEKNSGTLEGVIVEQKIKEFLKDINPKLEELEKKIETDANLAKENAVQEMGFSLSEVQKQIKELEDRNNGLQKSIEELEGTIGQKDQLLKDQEENIGKLTSEIENLSAMIKAGDEKITEAGNRLSGEIKKLSSELETKIGGIKEDIEARAKQADEGVTGVQKQLESSGEKVSGDITAVRELVESVKEKSAEEIVSVKKHLDSSIEKTGALLDSVMGEMETAAQKTASNLEQMTNDVNAQFQQVADTLKQQLEENAKQHAAMQSQIDEQGQSFKEFTETLTAIRDHISVLREETLKSFSEVKEDKKDLMQRFQRIVMGTAETLRNENIIVAKEVRNQLDTINKDFTANYYSIADGKALEDQSKRLGEELKENSEKIRDRLIENIDDAIKQFQVATKEAIGEVNELKLDIERYRDEILSLIERKVNEKYDFVFDILSNLLTRSEELKIIIRDSKLETP